MTKIDRYILVLFLRTVFVCFCSIAGIFIVFHAFTSMDEFVELGAERDGLMRVMLRFYGPYMLMLFDWTGAIIMLLSLLFVMGWLRHTGELTATLAAGVSHGRILRPIVVASLVIVLAQLANRELVLPGLRDSLSMQAKDIKGETEQTVLPCYDETSRILFEGQSLLAKSRRINQPNFRLYGDYGAYGDLMAAESATWSPATEQRPAGFLLSIVVRPVKIDELPSVGMSDRPILLTSNDTPWLGPKQCFVATTVTTELLSKDQSATRLSSIAELTRRVKNPAVRSSASLHVLLHERIVRVPLDFCLILLGLPLVVNRRDRNLFVMIGVAIGTVMFFFALKTLASAMGGSGYLMTPPIAAWVPLLVLGPVAYVRLREVQTV